MWAFKFQTVFNLWWLMNVVSFFGGGRWVTLVDLTITWRTGHQHFVRGCSWYMNCIWFSDGLIVKDMGGMIWLMNWEHDGCLATVDGKLPGLLVIVVTPIELGYGAPTAIYGNWPRENGMFHGLGKNWWHVDMQLIHNCPSVYKHIFWFKSDPRWSNNSSYSYRLVSTHENPVFDAALTWKCLGKIPLSGVGIPPFPPTNHLFGLVFLGSQDLTSFPSHPQWPGLGVASWEAPPVTNSANMRAIRKLMESANGRRGLPASTWMGHSWRPKVGRWRHGNTGAAGSHQ